MLETGRLRRVVQESALFSIRVCLRRLRRLPRGRAPAPVVQDCAPIELETGGARRAGR